MRRANLRQSAARIRAMTYEAHDGDPFNLGARDLAVLRLMATGLTDEEIANNDQELAYTVVLFRRGCGGVSDRYVYSRSANWRARDHSEARPSSATHFSM